MFLRNSGLIRAVNSSYASASRKCLSSVVDYKKTYPAEAGHVRKSPYEDIVVPNMTIDKYVWQNLRHWDSKVASVSDLL